MMTKAVRVILSPEAEEVYKYLNEQAANSKIERTILRRSMSGGLYGI